MVKNYQGSTEYIIHYEGEIQVTGLTAPNTEVFYL